MKYAYEIIVAYAYAGYNQGDVISRHKTYEAAQKAARKDTGGFWAIRAI